MAVPAGRGVRRRGSQEERRSLGASMNNLIVNAPLIYNCKTNRCISILYTGSADLGCGAFCFPASCITKTLRIREGCVYQEARD